MFFRKNAKVAIFLKASFFQWRKYEFNLSMINCMKINYFLIRYQILDFFHKMLFNKGPPYEKLRISRCDIGCDIPDVKDVESVTPPEWNLVPHSTATAQPQQLIFEVCFEIQHSC